MTVLVALVFVLFTLFTYWCYGIYRKNKIFETIPGPPPIPFFGIRLATDIYGIYTMFDNLFNTYGKTFKIYVGETLQIVTRDINLIEPILKSNVNLKKTDIYRLIGLWLKDGLIVSYGDKWKHRRRLCSPSFNFTTMKYFLNIFKQSTQAFVQKIGEEADKGTIVNCIEYTSKYALDVVGESSFGVKLNIQNGENKDYINAAVNFLTIVFNRHFSAWKRFNFPFWLFSRKAYKLQEKSLNILDTTALDIIKKKRTYYINASKTNFEEQSDENKYHRKCILVDTLMQNEDLSNTDILEEVNNFLFAGHDTTSTGLAHALYELSKRPDVQDRLYKEINIYIQNDINNLTQDILQDMKYLDMVVKEVLRFRSPVPHIERELQEDTLLGDIVYPKGTVITMLLHWLHRDPDLYSEPEKFNPERFDSENQTNRSPFAFIPFSAGARNCIGKKYAVMEIKTLIIGVVSQFIIHPVKDFQMVLGLAAVLRSRDGYPVRFERRKLQH